MLEGVGKSERSWPVNVNAWPGVTDRQPADRGGLHAAGREPPALRIDADADPTLLLGWADWDHKDQVQALVDANWGGSPAEAYRAYLVEQRPGRCTRCTSATLMT